MSVVTLSTKGQVVLPREVRQAMGLQKGDKLSVILEGDHLILSPMAFPREQSWQRWRGRLANTQALQQHLAEHADEVKRERLL